MTEKQIKKSFGGAGPLLFLSIFSTHSFQKKLPSPLNYGQAKLTIECVETLMEHGVPKVRLSTYFHSSIASAWYKIYRVRHMFRDKV